MNRLQKLTAANQKLASEAIRRREAESSLRQSERRQREMLKEARLVQVQMRDLSRRLLHAQEEERYRISRELHDEVLQTLVGINVQLEALRRESDIDPVQFKAKIDRTQTIVASSVKAVHRFARELRPMVLDDLGLIPALRSQISEFRKRTNVAVRFTPAPEVEALSNECRTVIYRLIQGALNNVAQHSSAQRASIRIQAEATGILVTIHDRGRAFDVTHTLDARRYKRLGLLGMRERVEMVGGVFTLTSITGRGTTVQAAFPSPRKTSKTTPPRR